MGSELNCLKKLVPQAYFNAEMYKSCIFKGVPDFVMEYKRLLARIAYLESLGGKNETVSG